MLRWRLIVGTSFVAALIALIWLDAHGPLPGAALIPLALVMTAAAAGEFLSLARAKGWSPCPRVVYGGNLLIVAFAAASYYRPLSNSPGDALIWISLGLFAATLAAFTVEIFRYQEPGPTMVHLAFDIFSLVYIGALFGVIVALRGFGGPNVGIAALASLVIVTKSADTGAYFAGRLLGRHKLAPRLSPGKTIEGLAGGVALACFASYATFAWLMPIIVHHVQPRPWWSWLSFGVAVTFAGLVGDLTESLLKRDAGRKDSSTWMPGLGGVLDVVDSLLVAAPVVYAFWMFDIVGP